MKKNNQKTKYYIIFLKMNNLQRSKQKSQTLFKI